MANLRSESEIERFLQPKIEIIVDEILKGIEEWNQREIERVVYAAGQPDVYQRADPEENFASAWEGTITKSTVHEVEGTFYYEPNNMSVGTSLDGEHVAMFSSEKYGTDPGFDMRPYLAEIIYEGLAGHIFGSGFWTEKRDAWERLIKIVGGSKMRTWINRGARRARLKISW